MFVLIGAFAVYRTRVGGRQAAGVLVTLLGVAIVAAGGDLARLATFTLNFGDALMIAACVLYAGYTLGLSRRGIERRVSSWQRWSYGFFGLVTLEIWGRLFLLGQTIDQVAEDIERLEHACAGAG